MTSSNSPCAACKILHELNPTHREDAVNSLAYEAEARLQNPVYGCVGFISILQHKLKQVQYDLYHSKNELAKYVGASALLPVFDRGLIQQNPPNMGVLQQCKMQPMMALQHENQMVIMQQQKQQMVDQAQQLVVMGTFEEHRQQQTEVVAFGNVYDSRQVNGSGFNHTTANGDISPFLALGTYDNNIDYNQTEQQQQPQQFLLQQPLERGGNEEAAGSFGPSI